MSISSILQAVDKMDGDYLVAIGCGLIILAGYLEADSRCRTLKDVIAWGILGLGAVMVMLGVWSYD